jgi:hypothetical protein
LYGKLSNDRITIWRLLLEEYGPKYIHIAGKNNTVADALSRLEKDGDEKLSETEEGLVLSHEIYAVEQHDARVMPEAKEELVKNIMNVDEIESEEFPMSPEIIAREQKKDTHLKEVMKKSDKLSERAVERSTVIRVMPETKEELVKNIMNVDEMESEECPMSPEIIAREQKKDTHLKEVMKKSDKLSERTVERSTVITYDNKVYIPISLRKRIVWWYHTYLQHPGITRMEATLRQNLTWTNLRKDVKAEVKNCHECQIGKKVRKKYGDLP